MDLPLIRSRISKLARSVSSPEPHETEPKAAVAAILRVESAGPEVLLIERAERIGDPWSGQMAFPGGRRASEETALDTAIRETMEEVAIDLRTHELLGPIADIPTHRTGLIVRLFTFVLTSNVTPSPHAREVADVLWVPMLPMRRGEVSGTYDFQPDGMDTTITLPCFRVPDREGAPRVVWGLTYRMLEVLFEALSAEQ